MKAVIMAGGEGKRLRPLTCTLPKPMVRICGKPVIEYTLELLEKHGFDEAVITLGYMPDTIREYFGESYGKMKLGYSVEEEPLGTAGSVRKASKDFDEPFVVISGDALCNFDLSFLVHSHRSLGSMLTIAAVKVDDPSEYGVIRHENSRITAFLEKPSKTQAVSGIVNTGIYVIDSAVMKYVPENVSFDFSRQLFPSLLKDEVPMYAVTMDGYWRDIGDTGVLMKCQWDMLDGIPGFERVSSGMPDGDYTIVPPVFIGKDTDIASGAVIGPYAIVEDGALIDKRAKVRYSVVSDNSSVGVNASLTGAMICRGACLRKDSSVYEGAVIGSGAIVGEGAQVKPGCLIWPGKIISDRAVVSDNVKYGTARKRFISMGSLLPSDEKLISGALMHKTGRALASVFGGKIGVAFDGTSYSEALAHAVSAGIAGSGADVWIIGQSYYTEFSYCVSSCGLNAGIFISSFDDGDTVVFNSDGLPLTGYEERALESMILSDDYKRVSQGDYGAIKDYPVMKIIYRGMLASCAEDYTGLKVSIDAENRQIKEIFDSILFEKNCKDGSDIRFSFSADGRELTAEEGDEFFDYDTLLAIVCFDELNRGVSVSVPFDAPLALDAIASTVDGELLRYLRSPSDKSDFEARRIAVDNPFAQDGLLLCIKVLNTVKRRELSLSKIKNELPEFYREKRTVFCSSPTSELSGLFSETGFTVGESAEGLKLTKENGEALIVPLDGLGKYSVFTESVSFEAAREIFDDVNRRMSRTDMQ